MLDKIVSIEQASVVVWIPVAWLREHVPIHTTADGQEGVVLQDAFDAVKNYPRDEKEDHRRLKRLRRER